MSSVLISDRFMVHVSQLYIIEGKQYVLIKCTATISPWDQPAKQQILSTSETMKYDYVT